MIKGKLEGVKFLVEKDKLGEYIKQKRLALNLTQEELAEKLYISATAVSKWENGKAYPDITIIAQVARVLKISVEEFISASDDTERRKTEYQAKKYLIIKRGFLLTLGLMFPIPVLGIFIITFVFTALVMNVYAVMGLFTDFGVVSLGVWQVTGIPAVLVTLVFGAGFLGLSWLSWLGLKKYITWVFRS